MSGRPPNDGGWQHRPAKRSSRVRRGRRRLILLVLLLLVGAVVVSGYLTGWRNEPDTPEAVTAPPLTKLVFPEGLRREEMAEILGRETGLSASTYLEVTGPSAKGAALAGRTQPTSMEGFLFPATYEIGTETTVEFLVDQQIRAFTRQMNTIDMTHAESKNLTRFDVVIIASMIEREVQVPSERPIVAGVIYNRLRLGMRLDIDATVQYAVGSWGSLTAEDLRSSSPYNTRRFSGLPPGPICNPGAASLEAAANPAEHGYLYYVAKTDGSGGHRFATTLEEFNRIQAEG